MARGQKAAKGVDPQKVANAAQKAGDFVDSLCAPDKMTPAEAKDYWEQVRDNINMSLEALLEEHQELRDL